MMSTNRQIPSTGEFLRACPVFTVRQFADALDGRDGTRLARERLKYHATHGRVKMLERGLYASVPAGLDPERYHPDRYLVAVALRPGGVLSHHAALELLGAAHSEWNLCTILSDRRRRPLKLGNVEVRFLEHPAPLRRSGNQRLGTRSIERQGVTLTVTAPERTLVDGFHQPRWVGGLEELVASASGFGVLDLELLGRLLDAYRFKTLYAAVGWFLQSFQETFFVPNELLSQLREHRPRRPVYLPRRDRGGTLVAEWNLVLPRSVLGLSACGVGAFSGWRPTFRSTSR